MKIIFSENKNVKIISATSVLSTTEKVVFFNNNIEVAKFTPKEYEQRLISVL